MIQAKKVREANFRELIGEFVLFDITPKIRENLKALPGLNESNCLVTYGYIDVKEGISFEILEGGKRSGGDIDLCGGLGNRRAVMRYRHVKDMEFNCLNMEDLLKERHKKRLAALEPLQKVNPGVLDARDMVYIDRWRTPENPDCLQVGLSKPGCESEFSLVRMTDQVNGVFTGILLNEPTPGFGVHMGDELNFQAARDPEGVLMLLAVGPGFRYGTTEAGKKTAIVYYSMNGNTEWTAGKVAYGTDAELIRIRPEKAYPDKGIRKFLRGGMGAVRAETPKLEPYVFDPDRYDRIVIGFPVWAGTVAPPVRTFAQEQKEALRGKKIAAYACQSGTGGEKALEKLRECLGCPGFAASMVLVDPKVKPKEENSRKIEEFREKLRNAEGMPGPERDHAGNAGCAGTV